MNTNQFLQIFKTQVKGTLREWRLEGKFIRNEMGQCPLTFVASTFAGQCLLADDWQIAGRVLSCKDGILDDIVTAIDADFPGLCAIDRAAVEDLRTKLLTLCRLTTMEHTFRELHPELFL